MLSRIRYRLRAIFRRSAVEREMLAEMQLHLDRQTERLVARGMSPARPGGAGRRAVLRPRRAARHHRARPRTPDQRGDGRLRLETVARHRGYVAESRPRRRHHRGARARRRVARHVDSGDARRASESGDRAPDRVEGRAPALHWRLASYFRSAYPLSFRHASSFAISSAEKFSPKSDASKT